MHGKGRTGEMLGWWGSCVMPGTAGRSRRSAPRAARTRPCHPAGEQHWLGVPAPTGVLRRKSRVHHISMASRRAR